MKKLKLEPLRPHTARGFRYLAVPKELIKNRSYSPLDFGAVFLYARMMEIATLSAQNEDKFTDKRLAVSAMVKDLCTRKNSWLRVLRAHRYPTRPGHGRSRGAASAGPDLSQRPGGTVCFS